MELAHKKEGLFLCAIPESMPAGKKKLSSQRIFDEPPLHKWKSTYFWNISEKFVWSHTWNNGNNPPPFPPNYEKPSIQDFSKLGRLNHFCYWFVGSSGGTLLSCHLSVGVADGMTGKVCSAPPSKFDSIAPTWILRDRTSKFLITQHLSKILLLACWG